MYSMRSAKTLLLLKKTSMILVVVLYSIAPLHEPLLNGIHRISHAISSHSAQSHHHHDSNTTHSREHKYISFFSTLFQLDNASSDSTMLVQELAIDKHLFTPYEQKEEQKQFKTPHLFYFTSETYRVFLDLVPPPPKHVFS